MSAELKKSPVCPNLKPLYVTFLLCVLFLVLKGVTVAFVPSTFFKEIPKVFLSSALSITASLNLVHSFGVSIYFLLSTKGSFSSGDLTVIQISPGFHLSSENVPGAIIGLLLFLSNFCASFLLLYTLFIKGDPL